MGVRQRQLQSSSQKFQIKTYRRNEDCLSTKADKTRWMFVHRSLEHAVRMYIRPQHYAHTSLPRSKKAFAGRHTFARPPFAFLMWRRSRPVNVESTIDAMSRYA